MVFLADSRCYKYDLKETLFQKEICQGFLLYIYISYIS